MMHREIVERKKVKVITILLLAVTMVLYISQGIKLAGLDNYFLGDLLNGILLVLIVFFIIKEIRSFSLAYKYSIIADKLIINRIRSREERNLESIKISDILYIGKKSEIPKKYNRVKGSNSYLCNRMSYQTYCCIYQKGDTISRFNFQPSNSFIERVLKHGKYTVFN